MNCQSSMLAASLAAVVVCVAPAAQAADSPEEICAKLRAALQKEVELLAAIDSTERAEESLSALRKSLQEQNDLFGADDEALWDYISNTDGVKKPLVELLERLGTQFRRMEENNYFDHTELKNLLYTQIVTEG